MEFETADGNILMVEILDGQVWISTDNDEAACLTPETALEVAAALMGATIGIAVEKIEEANAVTRLRA